MSAGHSPAAGRHARDVLLLLLLMLLLLMGGDWNGLHSSRLHDDFLRRQRVFLTRRSEALDERVGDDLSYSLGRHYVPETVRR